DGHVKRRRQVVASADVMELVRQNRVQLRGRQAVADARRQEQDWTNEADHAWLEQTWRGPDIDGAEMRLDRHRSARADGGPHATPSSPPRHADSDESRNPDKRNDRCYPRHGRWGAA